MLSVNFSFVLFSHHSICTCVVQFAPLSNWDQTRTITKLYCKLGLNLWHHKDDIPPKISLIHALPSWVGEIFLSQALLARVMEEGLSIDTETHHQTAIKMYWLHLELSYPPSFYRLKVDKGKCERKTAHAVKPVIMNDRLLLLHYSV